MILLWQMAGERQCGVVWLHITTDGERQTETNTAIWMESVPNHNARNADIPGYNAVRSRLINALLQKTHSSNLLKSLFMTFRHTAKIRFTPSAAIVLCSSSLQSCTEVTAVTGTSVPVGQFHSTDICNQNMCPYWMIPPPL